ncbi:MAG: ATP-binding protein [Actinomycetota bacterium]
MSADANGVGGETRADHRSGDDPDSTSEAMSLSEALRVGGIRTVGILGALALFDELDGAVIGIFAPEIQDSLGISTTALAAISTAAGAVFVAGAVPIARLADRTKRNRIVVAATLMWTVATALIGLAQNLVQFVVARVVTGLGKSNTIPVHGSMLADAYPERGRGAIYALHGASGPLGRVLAPLTVAVLTLVFTGDDAWRVMVPIVVIVPAGVAIIAWIWLPEPRRGANERRWIDHADGNTDDDPDDHPDGDPDRFAEEADHGTGEPQMSIAMAFARIRRIATFDRLATGIGVIGFTLFSVPIFVNLVLDERYGLSPGQRGVIGTIAACASVIAVPIGAGYGGRLFERDPGGLLRLMGGAVAAAAVCTSLAVFMPNAALLTVWFALGGAIGSAAFVSLSVIVAAIVPPKLRAQGFSLIGVYVFLIGGFSGSLLAGIVADSIGTRAAIPAVILPAAAIGGWLIARAAQTFDGDRARLVAEVEEEAAERVRRLRGGDVPTLQVRGLGVSIGTVPILHDIDLDVGANEIVAVVGTNGSGKSTLLRTISGLQVADHGVIRYGASDVTLWSAHARARAGVVQLAGGRSSFGPLSVRENFEVGALHVPARQRRKAIDRSLELFPELTPLLERRADRLSGGEQQMLGLARTMLLDPQLLLIDELSLGLAPVVVGRLVEALDDIRARGAAIVVVEQSLNIASSAADRVVFLDRGRVRFVGAGRELMERRDLARAVFLGGDA